MNRDCIYESTQQSTIRRSNEDNNTAKQPPRKRQRSDDRPTRSPLTSNPLELEILTPTVWLELFDIFQVHYSADLSFLHATSFKKPLRQAAKELGTTKRRHVRPPGSDSFLLAFLTLTARFHPALVKWHATATEASHATPMAVSEYFYTAAKQRSRQAYIQDGHISLSDLQSGLMICLYEWGSLRGAKAWLRIGVAIRSAQAVGMQYDEDLDNAPHSMSLAVQVAESSSSILTRGKAAFHTVDQEQFIEQEIRRRTFWSCFVLDRYVSSGKHRPQMLRAADIRIQLPVSEPSFLFAIKSKTPMLEETQAEFDARVGRVRFHGGLQRHESGSSSGMGHVGVQRQDSNSSVGFESMTKGDGLLDEKDAPWMIEVGSKEGIVSRFVRMVDIYGKVVQWSCAGGRRTEKHPPWDQRSTWHDLDQACADFKKALPRQHTLAPRNVQAHVDQNTSTSYILIHIMYLFCQIMLHREYVPFMAMRCSKPQGPLDPPLFDSKQHDIPPRFWAESAKNLFRSAREMIDLINLCQDCGHVLPETPIVGFAVYTASFVGVYCITFPWMDPDGYMCTIHSAKLKDADKLKEVGHSRESSKTSSNNQEVSKHNATTKRMQGGEEAAKRASEVLKQMRPTLPVANKWSKVTLKMLMYYRKLKQEYLNNKGERDGKSSSSSGTREDSPDGGLDKYEQIERELNDFDQLQDHDYAPAADSAADTQSIAEVLESGSSTMKLDEDDGLRGSAGSEEAERVEIGADDESDAPSPRDTDASSEQVSPAGQQSFKRPKSVASTQVYQQTVFTSPQDMMTSPMSAPSQSNQGHAVSMDQMSSTWTQHSASYSEAYNGYLGDSPNQPMDMYYGQSHAELGQAVMGASSMAGGYNYRSMPTTQYGWPATYYRPLPFNQLGVPLPGEDLAAFTDGGEPSDWVASAKGYETAWFGIGHDTRMYGPPS